MMAVHDEADVLPYNLDHYADAGFETIAVLDASSSDGSREICEAAVADRRILELEEFETDAHWLDRSLERLQALTARHCPDALMLASPDEFFEAADGSDLRASIESELEAGFNLIKFWNMEFHMTREDDASEPDPRRRMRHYSLWDVTMWRAYPYVDGIDLVQARGHRPVFPEGIPRRRSRTRFVSRHYPLRSEERALRKVERMRPVPETPKATTHYLRFSGDADELYVDPRHLHRYGEDHEWEFDQPFMRIRLRDTTRALERSERQRRELEARVAELEARLKR